MQGQPQDITFVFDNVSVVSDPLELIFMKPENKGIIKAKSCKEINTELLGGLYHHVIHNRDHIFKFVNRNLGMTGQIASDPNVM